MHAKWSLVGIVPMLAVFASVSLAAPPTATFFEGGVVPELRTVGNNSSGVHLFGRTDWQDVFVTIKKYPAVRRVYDLTVLEVAHGNQTQVEVVLKKFTIGGDNQTGYSWKAIVDGQLADGELSVFILEVDQQNFIDFGITVKQAFLQLTGDVSLQVKLDESGLQAIGAKLNPRIALRSCICFGAPNNSCTDQECDEAEECGNGNPHCRHVANSPFIVDFQ